MQPAAMNTLMMRLCISMWLTTSSFCVRAVEILRHLKLQHTLYAKPKQWSACKSNLCYCVLLVLLKVSLQVHQDHATDMILLTECSTYS